MYTVTLDRSGLSCSVKTVRPSGAVVFTKALIYMGSMIDDLEVKQRVRWGGSYVLAEKPITCNFIKWVHNTPGGKCFMWRRCDGDCLTLVSQHVAVLPAPIRRQRHLKTQFEQRRPAIHYAHLSPEDDESIFLSVPFMVKAWWLADLE